VCFLGARAGLVRMKFGTKVITEWTHRKRNLEQIHQYLWDVFSLYSLCNLMSTTLYPNPSNGNLVIDFKNEALYDMTPKEIRVYNEAQYLIYSETIQSNDRISERKTSNQLKIDLQNQPFGNYFVILIYPNGTIKTIKSFLKNKKNVIKMKKIVFAVIIIGLFSTCKKTPEPLRRTYTILNISSLQSASCFIVSLETNP
jgi:hypothetical protein